MQSGPLSQERLSPLSVCTFLTPININKYHTCTRKEASLSSLYAWQLWWLNNPYGSEEKFCFVGSRVTVTVVEFRHSSKPQSECLIQTPSCPTTPQTAVKPGFGNSILGMVYTGRSSMFEETLIFSQAQSSVLLPIHHFYSCIHSSISLQNVGNHIIVS